MSLFDYPRINFVGTIQLNPGTANNDDYAANFTYKGQPLGLIDSKKVEPRRMECQTRISSHGCSRFRLWM
jgi:hypothetical protein